MLLGVRDSGWNSLAVVEDDHYRHVQQILDQVESQAGRQRLYLIHEYRHRMI